MNRRLPASARLTLANAAVFALSFGALLMLVTWLSDRFMVGHVRESVVAELNILRAEQNVDGLNGVIQLIHQRLASQSTDHHRLYRLEDAGGTMLAGNIERWPDKRIAPGEFFVLPSLQYPGQTQVIFQWIDLERGFRLLVGFDEIEVADVRSDIHRAAWWSLGVMLLVSLSIAYLLTRTALKPVEAIRAAAQRIMDGDLRHRIPVRVNGDEFDRLGITLNSMLDRIEALIATVKGATDNIAHDLRSPLTRYRARLETALTEPPSQQELPAWIEQNVADLDQVLATFRALMRIASIESGLLREEFEDCDVAQLVSDAAEYIEPWIEEKNQRLEVTCAAGPTLRGHRNLLFQMLVNLLDNAVKYSSPGTVIELAAKASGGSWILQVADAGPGIPMADRQRVFERLYRVDASRNEPGLGLGLSLVLAIVELHKGEVGVEDNHPGTRLSVHVPISKMLENGRSY